MRRANLNSILTASAMVMAAAAMLQAAPVQTFSTPQEAAAAMVDAAEHNDTAALLKMFGPAGKDIVESGDPAAHGWLTRNCRSIRTRAPRTR
jgi:hypothetical protein